MEETNSSIYWRKRLWDTTISIQIGRRQVTVAQIFLATSVFGELTEELRVMRVRIFSATSVTGIQPERLQDIRAQIFSGISV